MPLEFSLLSNFIVDFCRLGGKYIKKDVYSRINVYMGYFIFIVDVKILVLYNIYISVLKKFHFKCYSLEVENDWQKVIAEKFT